MISCYLAKQYFNSFRDFHVGSRTFKFLQWKGIFLPHPFFGLGMEEKHMLKQYQNIWFYTLNKCIFYYLFSSCLLFTLRTQKVEFLRHPQNSVQYPKLLRKINLSFIHARKMHTLNHNSLQRTLQFPRKTPIEILNKTYI